ncbi:hypothetical protein [Reichenbachiella agariperforans]|uniref:Lipocalin-like domain-containing protein n=1 Tax=Reichenbachiella agariperforans TaxID=156994 RepID=A0A1M6T3G3_REIAG|nr:hypothetical protein [Reichenbachiella agariperforans]MBU2914825.1 hypothetical protein [Reichenbachiella agariperforans]SHK51429.1 hypothetical protein SAMN04488028_105268 [Reichenbachiella agariperforans]
MKIGIIYTAGFMAMIGLVCFAFANTTTPGTHLIGQWQEVSWTYEKLDYMDEHSSVISSEIDRQMKHEISEDLVIHEAEIWEFSPEGGVKLHSSKGNERHMNWRLKGRGNILKFIDEKNPAEHYQIKVLTEDKLEIHFSTDIGARGVVKMTFNKIGEQYAEKI